MGCGGMKSFGHCSSSDSRRHHISLTYHATRVVPGPTHSLARRSLCGIQPRLTATQLHIAVRAYLHSKVKMSRIPGPAPARRLECPMPAMPTSDIPSVVCISPFEISTQDAHVTLLAGPLGEFPRFLKQFSIALERIYTMEQRYPLSTPSPPIDKSPNSRCRRSSTLRRLNKRAKCQVRLGAVRVGGTRRGRRDDGERRVFAAAVENQASWFNTIHGQHPLIAPIESHPRYVEPRE